MSPDEIKDAIRLEYYGNDWARLWFVCAEVSHAVVNIPREILRKLGAPDAIGDDKNWADWLARFAALIPVAILLVLVFYCPTTPG